MKIKEVKCPKCESTFDITGAYDYMKDKFIEKIKKGVTELKNE